MKQGMNLKVVDNVSHSSRTYSIGNDRPVIIGRSKKCNIIINAPDISRTHMSLQIAKDRLLLKDLKSTNGTRIYDNASGQWIKLAGKKTVKPPVKIKLSYSTVITLNRILTQDSTFDDLLNQSIICDIHKFRKNCSICVIDMCDSSALASTDETLAYHLKAKLNMIVSKAFERNRGTFIKNTGDGFLMTFPIASNALNASRTIMDILAERNASTRNVPLLVRISLHWGHVYQTGKDKIDLHGRDVDLTFRLDGVSAEDAFGGKAGISDDNRILCTAAFIKSMKDESIIAPPEVVASGSVELKGTDGPVDVHLIQ